MDHDTRAMLGRAIELAVANVAAGGGPVGAGVVTRDGRAFEGVNRVTRDNDPTAHAEVVAIREACRELGTFDLTGAPLAASCEPAPMGQARSRWPRVAPVHCAAGRHPAAADGFGEAALYDFTAGKDRSLMRVVHTRHGDALAPFAAW